MANMIDNPPDTVPAQIVAGDTLKIVSSALAVSFPAASGWALSWLFVPMAGGVPVSVVATGGASDWTVSVADAVTSGWASGGWRWSVRATKAGGAITAASGETTVLPNPAANNVDHRTHAQRVLAALEAVIEGRASKSTLENTFEDGRSAKHMTHAELLAMRDKYAAKVAAEQRAKSGGPGRILARL